MKFRHKNLDLFYFINFQTNHLQKIKMKMKMTRTRKTKVKMVKKEKLKRKRMGHRLKSKRLKIQQVSLNLVNAQEYLNI